MKNKFIQECILVLKKEENKKYLKDIIFPFINPIVTIILNEIKPFIYLSLIFVVISFLLHLGIFILLFRNNSFF